MQIPLIHSIKSISPCLFVRLLEGLRKNLTDFHKILWKVAHEPRKNPSDFGDYPGHVTLGFGFGLGLSFLVMPVRTVTVR